MLSCCPGGTFPAMISVQPSIIDGHGQPTLSFPSSAQIGNFVAHLSDRIAEASQNNRRNPQYPEIPQLSKLRSYLLFSSE